MSRALFESLVAGGWPSVLALLEEPEGPQLEAKVKHDATTPKLGPAAASPGKPVKEDDRARIGKAISGLANGDGGLFLFGVRAQPASSNGVDRITRIEAIEKADECARNVENAIGGDITPPVVDIRVRSILEPGTSRGIVAVYVGASDGGPHRDASHRYYLRSGSSTQPMPHTTLADKFGRRPSPRLRVIAKPVPADDGSHHVNLSLRNDGRGAARQPALVLTSPRDGIIYWPTAGATQLGWNRLTDPEYGEFPRSDIPWGAVSMAGWASGPEVIVYPAHELFVTSLRLEHRPTQVLRFEGVAYALDAEPYRFGADFDFDRKVPCVL